MSLSASTISLFVLLIPGLIFRFAIFLGSPIKRPFSAGNSLLASITIVLFAITVHIIAFTFLNMVILPVIHLLQFKYEISVTQFNGILYVFENGVRYPVSKFIVDHKLISVIYFIYSTVVAVLCAWLFKLSAYNYKPIGRLLFGPLAPLIDSGNFNFLTCFVLTKTKHDLRYVAYAGYAVEVSLKDGSNIDHIVIEDPEKFFVKLEGNWPKTTYNKSRPISSGLGSTGLMYISGDEIHNVHFEGWYFN